MQNLGALLTSQYTQSREQIFLGAKSTPRDIPSRLDGCWSKKMFIYYRPLIQFAIVFKSLSDIFLKEGIGIFLLSFHLPLLPIFMDDFI